MDRKNDPTDCLVDELRAAGIELVGVDTVNGSLAGRSGRGQLLDLQGVMKVSDDIFSYMKSMGHRHTTHISQ